MKTLDTQTSLKSFERVARARGVGSLLVGVLLVGFWVGGHGALYNAYRVTETHAPAAVVAHAN
jgi:hypothetical protein